MKESVNKKDMDDTSEYSELDLLVNRRKFQKRPRNVRRQVNVDRDNEVRERFERSSRSNKRFDDTTSLNDNNLFSRMRQIQGQTTRPVTPRSMPVHPPHPSNQRRERTQPSDMQGPLKGRYFDNDSTNVSELRGSLFDVNRRVVSERKQVPVRRSMFAAQDMMNDVDNMFAYNDTNALNWGATPNNNNNNNFCNEDVYVEEPIDLADPENRRLMNVTASLLKQPEFKQLGGYMGQNKKLMQQNVINRIRYFQKMGFNPEDGYRPEEHTYEQNTDYVFRQEHEKTLRKNRRRLGNYLSMGSFAVDTLNRLSGNYMETTDLKKATKTAVEQGKFDEYLDDMDAQLRGTILDTSAANIFTEFMAIIEDNHYKQEAKRSRNRDAAKSKVKKAGKSKNLVNKIRQDNQYATNSLAENEVKENKVQEQKVADRIVNKVIFEQKAEDRKRSSDRKIDDSVSVSSVASSDISNVDLGDFPLEARPLQTPAVLTNVTQTLTGTLNGFQERMQEQIDDEEESIRDEVQSRQRMNGLLFSN